MHSSDAIRLHAIRPQWPHAWVCVGLITLTAGFAAMADGIQSWSVLGVYIIAAVCLFLAVQPWHSFLELGADGFRVVWGVRSTFTDWRDLDDLCPVLAPSGQYGGVAFSATRQTVNILGLRRQIAGAINGTLNGALYGICDDRLFQLMYDLRARAAGDRSALQASVFSGSAHEARRRRVL